MSDYRPVKLTIILDVSKLSLIDAEKLQTALSIPSDSPLTGKSWLDVEEVA